MTHPIRTFIALEINSEILDNVEKIQKNLNHPDYDVKWVRPQIAHVTLKFLGETPVPQIPEISGVIQAAIQEEREITTFLTEVNAFPHIKNPHVLWLGLADENERITTIATRIEKKLWKLGFDKEDRGFHPHITLGRVKSNRNIKQLIAKIESYPPLPKEKQILKNITLFQSTLSAQEPVYEPLKTITLQ